MDPVISTDLRLLATGKTGGPLLPNAVLGMLIFVSTEVMFFLALISGYLVIKAGMGAWVPPGEIRLPVAATALNTCILLLSGGLMYLAVRAFASVETRHRARPIFVRAMLLGGFFVAFQGYEWLKLIRYGMTMTSGMFGACFFLLIGCHGLHAALAVSAMVVVYRRMRLGRLTLDQLRALQIFWFFVVGIWPLLYGLVYF